eukprot:CAMPEP_0113897992 /NCGR_PEP_ID=MMETSP0780_2-20120614/19063_1 /TAXON_ID=652834 /ORGANISM="Palpitomonas bilix" /LENGTH=729 /DNA_ID=CAMNT_0000889669 /DNA_START=185 /DNA_END=2374 /DNA_ORIENTATION=- /assembly_acc=CAM_ASM_000599
MERVGDMQLSLPTLILVSVALLGLLCRTHGNDSFSCSLQDAAGQAAPSLESLAAAQDANDTAAIASSVCQQANATSSSSAPLLEAISAAALSLETESENATTEAMRKLGIHSEEVNEVVSASAELNSKVTAASSLLTTVNSTRATVQSLPSCNATMCSTHASSRVTSRTRRPRIRVAMDDTACDGTDPDQSGCSKCIVPTNLVMTCENDVGRGVNLSVCFDRGVFASRVVRYLTPTSVNETTRVFTSPGVSGSCCVSASAGLYNCECATGYSGSACTQCASGYFGSNCTSCPISNGTVCGGHGTCDDGMAGSGLCTCDTGYAGSSCVAATTCSSLPPSLSQAAILTPSTGTDVGNGGTLHISADSLVIVAGLSSGGDYVGVDVWYRASISASFTHIQYLTYGSSLRMGYRRPVVSGDHQFIAVSDIGLDTPFGDAGAVYTYKWNSDTEQYEFLNQLTSLQTVASTQLGHSGPHITYDGTRIFAAHYTANVPSAGTLSNVGGVSVYNWDGSTQFDEVQYVMPADLVTANMEFGRSKYGLGTCVSADGTWALMSTSVYTSSQGVVVSFKYNGTTYNEVQRISDFDYDSVAHTDGFGRQIACNDDLSIAAISTNPPSMYTYILSRTGDTFTFEQKMDSPAGSTANFGHYAGFVMSPDGYVLLIGDYSYNSNEGCVYMYTKDEGAVSYSYSTTIYTGEALGEFGKWLAIGSDYSMIATVKYGGVFRVFHFQCV